MDLGLKVVPSSIEEPSTWNPRPVQVFNPGLFQAEPWARKMMSGCYKIVTFVPNFCLFKFQEKRHIFRSTKKTFSNSALFLYFQLFIDFFLDTFHCLLYISEILLFHIFIYVICIVRILFIYV